MLLSYSTIIMQGHHARRPPQRPAAIRPAYAADHCDNQILKEQRRSLSGLNLYDAQ